MVFRKEFTHSSSPSPTCLLLIGRVVSFYPGSVLLLGLLNRPQRPILIAFRMIVKLLSLNIIKGRELIPCSSLFFTSRLYIFPVTINEKQNKD